MKAMVNRTLAETCQVFEYGIFMSVKGAQERITKAVTSWEGVTANPHRFGGVEYVIGKREIGHIHGDHLVDIPFPKKVRDEIVATGRAQPHHIMPETGWVSFYLQRGEDVEQAIDLLRESFEVAMRQKSKAYTRLEET
jgi:predicted DNA-binding protein (MmcQ/YjbR family)